MISVFLTDAEMVMVHMLGGMRAITGRAAGVQDKKMGPQSGVSIDEDGMVAEYAFCKHFNLFPDLVPGPRSGTYDCIYMGKRIDIKSTRHANGRLLATLKDNPDVDVYVLGIIDGQTVHFPGYAKKSALCREENKTSLGHGVGYAMDQKDLTPWKKDNG